MSSIKHPIVGVVRFQPTGGGGIRLLDGWEAENIETVLIPQLKGIPTYNGLFSGRVRFYKKAIPQLQAAFAEIGRLGLRNDILFWDGSFVPRMKRGSSTSPSEHTFGCALDINAQWNGFREKPAAPGTKGSVWRLVPVFKQFGFEAGAEWKNTPDGMHMQIKRLMAVLQAPTSLPAKPAAPTVVNVNGHPIKYGRVEGNLTLLPARILESFGYNVKFTDNRQKDNSVDISVTEKVKG